MQIRRQQALAIFFSILLVTATLTPAAAALEPSNSSDSDDSLLGVGDFLSYLEWTPDAPGGGNGNGNGNGHGKPTTETTTAANDGTTTVETTTRGGPKNGNEKGGRPPKNGNGPPENPGGGPPENPSGGPPENPGGGPPENPGGGPPANPGGSDSDRERGPPEWVRSSNTPPAVENRSALKNRSDALAGADVNVTIEDDASAVDYRLAAIDALQNADFDGPGRSAERHRTKALESLNDSLEYVLDANRTTSAELFELDKRASTPPKFAPNVTNLLVRSDEKLAETAIADAERVNETLHARNVSFDVDAVEENVSDAKAAVERAERFRDRGRDHAAVSQYRVAWIHAQQALDLMDLAVTPNVTITTREDMPHEGNVTYEVRGRVFDVRGHELDPLELSLNGENRSVALDVNTTPGAIGTFETNLTLIRKINDVEVSATDPNRRWAPDSDDADPTTSSDTLWLDADGLPDRYELNASATDPLDYDSNSTRTDRNESGNAVIDGNEDFDNDSVSTFVEYKFGIDPFDNDTDGDSLTDHYELSYLEIGVNPLTADSDNDSVPDSAEDFDADNLSNVAEQRIGTHPARNDSDGDGLSDGFEVNRYGTDPLSADTDEDGLSDSDELEVGTDPLVPDSDGDGILDGEETFTTSKKDGSTGVTVAVEGKGNAAKNTTIRRQPQYHNGTAASAGPVVSVDNSNAAERATVTIPYANDSDPSEVTVFVRRTSGDARWHAVPTAVDAANGTASANVSKDALVTVLNRTEWQRGTTAEKKPKRDVTSANVSCGSGCSVSDGGLTIGSSPHSSSESGRTRSILSVGTNPSENFELVRTGDRNETVPTNKSRERDEPSKRVNDSLANGPFNLTVSDDKTSNVSDADFATASSEWGKNHIGTVRLSDNIYSASLKAEIDATVEGNSTVKFVVGSSTAFSLSSHGGSDSVSDHYEYVSLSRYAGESVDLYLYAKTDDRASISITYDVDKTYDSDGDNVRDSRDDCPNEYGRDPVGCPYEDTDDDGTYDRFDTCPKQAGTNPNGCPTRGEGVVTVNVPEDAEAVDLDLHYSAEKNIHSYDVDVTLVGRQGLRVEKQLSPTGGEFEERTFDLSQFGGQTVSLKFDTTAAKLDVSTFRLKVDTDGDGLYDHLERERWYLPTTGNEFSTDATVADSDGDGFDDGDEVTLGFDRTELLPNRQRGAWRVQSSRSDPSRVDSDLDGLTDYEEREVSELNGHPMFADTDGDGIEDGRDPAIRDPSAPTTARQDVQSIEWVDATGNVTKKAVIGALLGDAGKSMGIEERNSVEYFGGWFVGSVAPTVDVVADARDCVIVNPDTTSNVLDCGGAVISLVGSGGTILGGATSFTGLGAILGGGSFALDTAEDATDAVSITVTFLKWNPELAESVGVLVAHKLGPASEAVIPRVTAKLDDATVSRKFERGARVGYFESKAEFGPNTAAHLARASLDTGLSMDEVATHARRVDDFDSLSGGGKRAAVKALARSDDAGRLADELSGPALRAISNAGVTDEATAAVKAGKAGEVGTLASKVGDDPYTFRRVLKVGALDEAQAVAKTNGGPELLKALDSKGMQHFLKISSGEADKIRAGIVIAHRSDKMSSAEVARFAEDVRALEATNTEGLGHMLNGDIVRYTKDGSIGSGDWSNVKGAVYEVRVAVGHVGPESVKFIGKQISMKSNADVVFDWSNIAERLGEKKLGEIVEETKIPKSQLDEYDSELAYVKEQLKTTELEIDVQKIVTEDKIVYVEAKAGKSSSIDTEDILSKVIRLKAYGKATGKETEMVLVSKYPKAETRDVIKRVASNTDGLKKTQYADRSYASSVGVQESLHVIVDSDASDGIGSSGSRSTATG